MEELGVESGGVRSDGVNSPTPSLTHSLTKALEDLFEKSLAEAAAEELYSHALVREVFILLSLLGDLEFGRLGDFFDFSLNTEAQRH